MKFGNCFAFQCSWKDKQLIFSGLGVRKGAFGGFFNFLIQVLMEALETAQEFPNTFTLRWSGLQCPDWRTQHSTCQQFLHVSSPGSTTRLLGATAHCPLVFTRRSCVCVGFRHSLVPSSSATGATQQCSDRVGRMNVMIFEFLVCLGERLKNTGELVSSPWCPSNGELKFHMILKHVSNSQSQMGSTSPSFFRAATGFPRTANSVKKAGKMLQKASFTPAFSLPTVLLAACTSLSSHSCSSA